MTCSYCGDKGCVMCRERITAPGPSFPAGLAPKATSWPDIDAWKARYDAPLLPQGAPGRPIPPELDWVVEWLKQRLLCKIGPSGELLIRPPHTGAEFVEFIASAIEHGKQLEREGAFMDELVKGPAVIITDESVTSTNDRDRFELLDFED